MKKRIHIQKATRKDAVILADIIRKSYQTVAHDFCLTPDNCPKHPSNCTPDWITRDLDRGVSYHLCLNDNTPVGCAALERAGNDTVYLERLAVLPGYRHQGIGEQLVAFIIKKAKNGQATTLGIGIIDEQEILKHWYRGLGFKMTGTRKFGHLPFTVGFMELTL